MKISIMIPLYNTEKYISKCIQSILRQTFVNWELIIMDDGSTDSSLSLAREFERTDSRIIVHEQNNQGLLKTRRNLLRFAKGELFMFLDSDDYLDIGALQKIYDIYIHEKFQLLIFKYERVDVHGKHLNYQKYDLPYNNNNIFDDSDKRVTIKLLNSSSLLNNLVCKVVHRDLMNLDTTNYEQYFDISNGEDLIQSLPLLINSKKTIYLNEHMYKYRYLNQSMSNKIDQKTFRDIYKVRLRLIELLSNSHYENSIREFYNYYIKMMFRNLLVFSRHNGKKDLLDCCEYISSQVLILDSYKYDISFFNVFYRWIIKKRLAFIFRILRVFK